MKSVLNDRAALRSTLRVQLSGKLFAAYGLWMVLLGAYFMLLRPALLPEDLHFMGTSIEALRAAVPSIERWLDHVFNVMGGFMIAAGVMTMHVAWQFLANRSIETLMALTVGGLSGVLLMSVTNFMLHSNFRWLLVMPVLLWVAGLVRYLREGAIASTAPRLIK